MNRLPKFLYAFLASLTLVLIWGLTLLDAKTANQTSVMICFVFTPFLIDFAKSNTGLITGRLEKLVFSIGPGIYLIMLLFTYKNLPFFVTNPIVWILATFSVHLFKIRLAGWKEWIFVIFWAYFYSFHIYPYFQKFNVVENNEIEKSALNLEATNPLDFKYIDQNLDTSSIAVNKALILIETWNEKCVPCVKSIKKLEPIIDEYAADVSHIYLYIHSSAKSMKPEKVMAFEMVKNKDKILVDIKNGFFDETGMESYPYFILYDESGKYIDHFVGYSDNDHDKFEKRIREMINKGKRSSLGTTN